MEFIFWLSALLVVYIYAGYPLLLNLLARFKPLKVKSDVELYQPGITILIAAYNEADVIAANLDNKLIQDYPQSKLKIVVVSDESEDGTDDIVKQYADRNVTLLRQSPRQGKTAGLNMAVEWLRSQNDESEILVFSDANSIYAENTISKLVNTFCDNSVGYVTGKMVYVNADGSLVGDGCSAYMKYENQMRSKETEIGSVVGVDGGVDAMRKSLHTHLNSDQLPDFVQPLKVVEQGYRVAYEPEAILKEESLGESASEYRMRVRVSLRALWALHDMRQLMNPGRTGIFAWQLISHKLLRYLAFIPLILTFITSMVLCNDAVIYALALLTQVVFYILAYMAHKKKSGEKPWYLTLPYYFTLLNIAAAAATIKYLKGEKMVVWKPRLG